MDWGHNATTWPLSMDPLCVAVAVAHLAGVYTLAK